MSLALSTDTARRCGFFHLHKFHSNRWQRNNLRISSMFNIYCKG